MNWVVLAAIAFAVSTGAARAQQACLAVPDRPDTPARKAYAHGNYREAQEMYEGELILRPDDRRSAAGLVQTLLHEGKMDEAATQAAKLVAADPNSAISLTAQAEVQQHKGQPWFAMETLAAAEKADPCYARIYLLRSQVLRMDSRYSSERAEVLAAYQIDAKDPDIHRAWLGSVQPAHEITSIHESLATMKDVDAETRKQAERSIRDMMPLLSENNQTCQVIPPLAAETTIPMAANYRDAKRIDGYKLEVQLAQTKVHLTVDTAASGLFISRAVADANGLTASPDAPAGTVRADSVKVGGLEFKDCIVGVSDTPFADKADGFIGTDLFASWLIDLDQPASKLTLSKLPGEGSVLPVDRPTGDTMPAELQGFSPVYHRKQYLLVPVILSNTSKRLFVLDSGSRVSTMSEETAHAISTMKMNFTNAVQTVGGRTIQVYRDSFDFQFASLTLSQQSHIVEFDPSGIERSSGIEVAGVIGFDMLHAMDVKLDYRDGLVKLTGAGGEAGPSRGRGNAAVAAAPEVACADETNVAQHLNTTIQGKVVGLIDSSHLKAGSKLTLKLVTAWRNDKCDMAQDSPIYAHVAEARSMKSPDSSELSLVIDAGECFENGRLVKTDLSLKIIGLVGPPDQFVGLQSAMPVQVSGGGRDISAAAANIGSGSNQFSINLNPDGPPETIKHGIVRGLPGVTLEPQGGPGCSAKITGNMRSIHFGAGSQFILSPAGQ